MTNLVIIVVLFGLSACALAYVSKLKATVKLTILPLFMVGVVVGYLYFLEEIGKPAAIPLPEKSLYVAHRVTNEDTIIVWLRTDEDRLYVIPYTRESAKELEAAREGVENGEEQQVTVQEDTDGGEKISTGTAIGLTHETLTK